MSIMYCEKHDRRWDSDFLEECPICENEYAGTIGAYTMKHTPLPWSISVAGLIYGKYNEPIARLGPHSLFAGSMIERNANGRYIVQACNAFPDLLETLKLALQVLQDDSPRSFAIGTIQSIIAKAERDHHD